jgi:hypothetical protein
MSKHNDPLLEALEAGQSYTWTVPDGGNRASMRKAIVHGQTLTMSPIGDPSEIQVGDKVLVKWHNSTIFHLVGEIQAGKYLIVNSLGGVNGWVEASAILGRITQVVEPEPRPQAPVILDQLEAAYRRVLEQEQAGEEDAARLLSIVGDLRWYADRIGSERLDEMPREDKWTFHQNLWWLFKRVRKAIDPAPGRLMDLIDTGKRIVGEASEILTMFAGTNPY